jgi:uncharacterized membrane protein
VRGANRVAMTERPRTLRGHVRSRQTVIADAITRFSGSFVFIEIHAVWFVAWIVLNEIPSTSFDAYPFGLLTLIVSLEAIFLSTFVLMSQNRTAQRDEEREADDLRVSVLTSIWAEEIGAKLGVDADEVARRTRERLAEHGEG